MHKYVLRYLLHTYTQSAVGEEELDSDGPSEPLCSELEWELISLGTRGGTSHSDMPGLYRVHSLPSRPGVPTKGIILSNHLDKEVRSGRREQRAPETFADASNSTDHHEDRNHQRRLFSTEDHL